MWPLKLTIFNKEIEEKNRKKDEGWQNRPSIIIEWSKRRKNDETRAAYVEKVASLIVMKIIGGIKDDNKDEIILIEIWWSAFEKWKKLYSEKLSGVLMAENIGSEDLLKAELKSSSLIWVNTHKIEKTMFPKGRWLILE